MDDDRLYLGRKMYADPVSTDVEDDEFDFPRDDDANLISLPVSILKKHVSILGSSGSGKTVLGKVFLEECAIHGIPSIIIDPQGDLASLAILGRKGEVESEGTSAVAYANYMNRTEVRIFTPASKKGIPLSVNPLKMNVSGLTDEEITRALDLVCTSMVGILGYKPNAGDGKAAHNFIFTFLKTAWQNGYIISDFSQFSELVLDPAVVGIENPKDIITDRERLKLSKNLKYLSMGMEQLLFNYGIPVDINAFLTPVQKGRVPVNVIYLNTLTSEDHKQFFVAMIAREIYTYMLQHPSTDLQLLFLIDEIAPYLPPHPRKPPAKDMLKLLFKQGRKYGVSCIMCTQNPADVDYKAMAQASTWALGRMMAKQDLDKIRHILKGGELTDYSNLITMLPQLKPGEFILIAPDALKVPEDMKVRYLITEHRTLDEEVLLEHIPDSILSFFENYHSAGADPNNTGGMNGQSGAMDPAVSGGQTPGSGMGPGSSGSLPLREGSDLFSLGKNLEVADLPEDSILFPEIVYHQSEVLKEAKKKLEGTLIIFKKEEIEYVDLRLVPIWKVGFHFEDYAGWIKIPLFGKKEMQYHNAFFHGETGEILLVEDKLVKFSDLNTRNPGKLNFFGNIRINVKKINDLPSKAPMFMFSESKIRSKTETTLGGKPVRIQKMVFPVWEVMIKEKELKQRRKIFIDAIFGKEVMMD